MVCVGVEPVDADRTSGAARIPKGELADLDGPVEAVHLAVESFDESIDVLATAMSAREKRTNRCAVRRAVRENRSVAPTRRFADTIE